MLAVDKARRVIFVNRAGQGLGDISRRCGRSRYIRRRRLEVAVAENYLRYRVDKLIYPAEIGILIVIRTEQLRLVTENSRIGIAYVVQIRRSGLYLVQQYDRIGGRAVVGIYIVDVFGCRINAERIDDKAARADAAAIVQNLRTTLKLGKLRGSEPIALVNDISRTSRRHSGKSEREAK